MGSVGGSHGLSDRLSPELSVGRLRGGRALGLDLAIFLRISCASH